MSVEKISVSRALFFTDLLRYKNFSHAAVGLGVSRGMVYHEIRRLEELAGGIIVVKDKNKLELTKLGEEVLELCRGIVAAYRSFQVFASSERKLIPNALSIVTTSGIAELFLPNVLLLLKDHYFDLMFSISTNAHALDPTRNVFDVYIGYPSPSSLSKHKIKSFQYGWYAGKKYIEMFDVPKDFEDLKENHYVLLHAEGITSMENEEFKKVWAVSSNHRVLSSLCNQGAGICYLPVDHFFQDKYDMNQLTRVLPDIMAPYCDVFFQYDPSSPYIDFLEHFCHILREEILTATMKEA